MSLFTHDHELLEDFFLNHKNVFTDGIFKRPPLQHVDNVFECLTKETKLPRVVITIFICSQNITLHLGQG